MNTGSLFSFVPQLKPYQIIPSEDDPKEFILLLEENGASLGIDHTERRLIESFDGRMAVGDIVLRITGDSSAKMTEVRRLLWDLDRFGFLEASPWQDYSQTEAHGYWGTSKRQITRIYYSSILGGIERKFVQLMLNPIAMLLAIVIFMSIYVGVFFIQTGEQPAVWSNTRLLIINQSVALGVLALLFGIVAALFVSAWAAASVVSALHESPAGIAVFWQSSYLRLMVDGRRLRILPIQKAICAGLMPSLKLLGIANVLSVAAVFSEGVRQEWLLHLSLAFAATGFVILLPWCSTILSRDVVLRLRGDSVFWTAWRSVQKSFQSLFHSTKDAALHEKLFIAWGIWSVVSVLIALRLAAMLFRADFPVLYTHFLHENNPTVLWVFLAVTAIVVLAALTTLVTFFVWLARALLIEIRHRAFPERHKDIAVFIPILYLFIGALCIASGNHQSHLFVNVITFLVGVSILWIGIRLFQREHTGLDFYTHVMVIFNGLALMIYAIEHQFQVLLFIDKIIITFPLFFLILFNIYYTIRSNYIFTNNRISFKPLPIVLIFIVTAGFHFFHNVIGNEYIIVGWDISSFYLLIEIIVMLMIMYQLNSITNLFVIASFSIYIAILEAAREQINPELFLFALAMALGQTHAYLILRNGFLKSVSLQSNPQSLSRDWNITALRDKVISAVNELCASSLVYKYTHLTNEDQLRDMLRDVTKFLGCEAAQTLFYRAANDLPWDATQKLASLMPPNVSLPKLTNWDEEKVALYLRNVPTFMHAGSECKAVAAICRFRFYEKGDRMITQNTEGGELLILTQGKAVVDAEHAFGSTRLAIMTVGDFVGEIGFLSGAPRTATVRAIEPVMAISVSRQNVDDSMPKVLQSIREAEAGQSWLQALHQVNIFREFSPSLLSRVSLESQHVYLDVSRTLLMHQEPYSNCVAVLLSGEAVFQQDGYNIYMEPGSIVGLVESMLIEPVKGIIRAERQSHLLLVDNGLFNNALIELLTPKQILAIED